MHTRAEFPDDDRRGELEDDIRGEEDKSYSRITQADVEFELRIHAECPSVTKLYAASGV
jgi:hypothetical protein